MSHGTFSDVSAVAFTCVYSRDRFLTHKTTLTATRACGPQRGGECRLLMLMGKSEINIVVAWIVVEFLGLLLYHLGSDLLIIGFIDIYAGIFLFCLVS